VNHARAGSRRRAAGVLFVSAAFLFLAVFLAANVRQLQAHEWSIRPGLLVLSMLIQALGFAAGALAWQLLLRRMGSDVSFLEIARVRFVSGLARYIPGKIWPFVGAVRLAGSAGMSATLTITSLAAHTVFVLIAALLTAAWLLPLEAIEIGVRLELLRWTAPLFLLLAHPRIIGLALALIARLTRQHNAGWTGGWVDGLWLVAVSVLGWLISGVALVTFILALTPLPPGAFTAVIGINAFAFVLGQLFFIAPAGLGAKEGALAALLGLYVGIPAAALIAIGARVWTTLVELLVAALLLRRPRGSRRAG
jgi:glycosyltransferase 2 family protein